MNCLACHDKITSYDRYVTQENPKYPGTLVIYHDKTSCRSEAHKLLTAIVAEIDPSSHAKIV